MRSATLVGTLFTLPALLLLAVFGVALGLVLQYSLLRFIPGSLQTGGLTLANYAAVVQPLYLGAIWDTIWLSFATALLTLVASYPIAYALARSPSRWVRTTILVLTIVPFFTGAIVRTYSWLLVLGNNGFLNSMLLGLGVIQAPITMLFTPGAVLIALVQYSMPVMIVLLAAAISHIDPNYERAAKILGAGSIQTFARVTLPLSLPGIVSGFIVIFAWTFSAFPTPKLVGGGKVKMIANVIEDLALDAFNFPYGAAFAVVALAATLAILLGASWAIGRRLQVKLYG